MVQTNLQNRNRVTDVENKLVVTEEVGRRRINWEIGVDIDTLLYVKYITNKNLLYSLRNYSQYLYGLIWKQNLKTEWLYVCV